MRSTGSASRRCASTATARSRAPSSEAIVTQRAESIFRSPSFLRFYLGQLSSYLGYGLRLIAIPLLVFRLTHSAHALGATYACELGPFAIFGLIGGSLADRVDRRAMMMWCDGIRFGVLASFAVALATNALSLPWLFAGIAIEATAAGGFVNAQTTSIRYLLGKDRATEAIAALIATEQASTSVLPPLGATLFTITGPLPALVVNALTYLTSFGFIASVRTFGPDAVDRPPAATSTGHFFTNVVSDVADGFRWLVRDRAMSAITGLSFFFNLFGLAIGAVLIPFLKVDLGASDRGVGIAFGISAIGSVIGSFVAGRVPKSWPIGRMLLVSYALDGVLFLPCVYSHDYAIVVLFLAIANGLGTFEITQIVGWRIRVTPEPIVGRVTSAARLVALIGTIPGALLGGIVADHYGARVVVAIGGYAYLAMAVTLALVPAIRNERR